MFLTVFVANIGQRYPSGNENLQMCQAVELRVCVIFFEENGQNRSTCIFQWWVNAACSRTVKRHNFSCQALPDLEIGTF